MRLKYPVSALAPINSKKVLQLQGDSILVNSRVSCSISEYALSSISPCGRNHLTTIPSSNSTKTVSPAVFNASILEK